MLYYIMEGFRKIILLVTIFSFMSVGWGQWDSILPELEYFNILTSTVDECGDVSGDGYLNILDVVRLVNIILKY